MPKQRVVTNGYYPHFSAFDDSSTVYGDRRQVFQAESNGIMPTFSDDENGTSSSASDADYSRFDSIAQKETLKSGGTLATAPNTVHGESTYASDEQDRPVHSNPRPTRSSFNLGVEPAARPHRSYSSESTSSDGDTSSDESSKSSLEVPKGMDSQDFARRQRPQPVDKVRMENQSFDDERNSKNPRIFPFRPKRYGRVPSQEHGISRAGVSQQRGGAGRPNHSQESFPGPPRLQNVAYVSHLDDASTSMDISTVGFVSKEAAKDVFCRRIVPLEIPVDKDIQDEVSAVSLVTSSKRKVPIDPNHPQHHSTTTRRGQPKIANSQHQLTQKKDPLKLQGVEYYAQVDVAVDHNDLSTVGGGISPQAVKDAFGLKGAIPRIIPVHDYDDVSTIHGSVTRNHVQAVKKKKKRPSMLPIKSSKESSEHNSPSGEHIIPDDDSLSAVRPPRQKRSATRKSESPALVDERRNKEQFNEKRNARPRSFQSDTAGQNIRIKASGSDHRKQKDRKHGMADPLQSRSSSSETPRKPYSTPHIRSSRQTSREGSGATPKTRSKSTPRRPHPKQDLSATNTERRMQRVDLDPDAGADVLRHKRPTKLQEVEYLASVEVASHHNDLSTVGNGVSKNAARSAFNKNYVPQEIPIGEMDDVSTIHCDVRTADGRKKKYGKRSKPQPIPEENTQRVFDVEEGVNLQRQKSLSDTSRTSDTSPSRPFPHPPRFDKDEIRQKMQEILGKAKHKSKVIATTVKDNSQKTAKKVQEKTTEAWTTVRTKSGPCFETFKKELVEVWHKYTDERSTTELVIIGAIAASLFVLFVLFSVVIAQNA